MNTETMSAGGFGFIALFLLILFALFTNGGFFGGNRCGGGYWGDCGNALGYGWHATGDIRSSICASEKQNIIDSASTRYLIEQQGSETRAYIGNKIDFYEYQNLRDKLQEAQSKNMFLENQIAEERRYTSLQAQITELGCNMLKKPEVRGLGYVCNGSLVPPDICGGGATV